MRSYLTVVLGLAVLFISGRVTEAADPPPLPDYFKAEVARLTAKPLLGIKTAEEWKSRRLELKKQLINMLGLKWDEPTVGQLEILSPEEAPSQPRDLDARVTGILDRPDFVVEKLVFRSAPGLYVTANLYRPKKVEKPLPAILYVCGHSRNEKDGVVEGCKAHYQHHAAWYAANGYVCLMLDTLQLGELPGLHHGTGRFGMWWWASLGYTPAGIEALNAIRGIDYLLMRKEVNAKKLGVTGRSGGGATSWWVGAIDDRVSVVIPVAGVTDLQNHVNDGVVEGHCDCMYYCNTERWDFDTLAALVAPKALLVENTDKDPIFPEDGVRRIYSQLERVYEWYGEKSKLGLVIGKGGHADTVELRHPSFAFMDKWLKGVDRPIVEPDRHIPEEDLIVLEGNFPPEDCRNALIHETFRKVAKTPSLGRPEDFAAWADKARIALGDTVFVGWPSVEVAGPTQVKRGPELTRGPFLLRRFDFQSQAGVALSFWSIEQAKKDAEIVGTRVEVIDHASWVSTWSSILDPSKKTPITVGDGSPAWLDIRARVLSGMRVLFVLPRGVGPTAWPAERDKHTRRRYLLLGQSLDVMRAWDITRAIAGARDMLLLPESRKISSGSLQFSASGEATTWLLWALINSEPTRGQVEFTGLPHNVLEAPAYPNVATVLDMPQAVTLLFPAKVRLKGTTRTPWSWALNVRDLVGGNDLLEVE